MALMYKQLLERTSENESLEKTTDPGPGFSDVKRAKVDAPNGAKYLSPGFSDVKRAKPGV